MSKLADVNTRRLIDFIEPDLKILLEQFLFEPNDELTRNNVSYCIENYLSELMKIDKIEDYGVICDKVNNTPYDVDRHYLNVSVYLKPTKVAEFIHIPITISPQGNTMVSAGNIHETNFDRAMKGI